MAAVDAPRPSFNPRIVALDCPECGRSHDLSQPRAVCEGCGRPLLARYDLERIGAETRRDALTGSDLWRYRAALPFAVGPATVRLGEGGTPLLPLARLGRATGIADLTLKDEAPNPTQSFKARGLALAVNGALAFGKQAIALPSAGNAGSAAAAYAAAAGIRCRITVPDDTPEIFAAEQRAFGAEVRLVPGTIADAGKALGPWAPAPEWWNVATFKEPFRLEGKKTLGWEIAEQCGWRLPDVILYPTGGGTGLVGMWRAFRELEALGWVEGDMPRLIAVQPTGCAPVVRAFEAGESRAKPWENARTAALGLRVPGPFADTLILEAIRGSGGTAVAVEEDELLEGMTDLAAHEGCFACPEGGATLAALRRLRARGDVSPRDRVVLFNTGSGLKYPEAWRMALARRAAGAAAGSGARS
ncbi:MAG: threonine synthase [Candidatus Eisenbacteria bacterium]|uniref:Threonine synthase n=1 Tax=Eiseniibacteriota bacterium TaxID=2212470 RepID=A0A9D6L6Z8_UNCEI|nr:threonine synthase [Candidatus Eisenbacteria bacterium]MBI3539936.1 threonine synthase [Candidatus Eisenbacteria bacterium]